MAVKRVLVAPETTVVSMSAKSYTTGWKDCNNVPNLSFLTVGETYIVDFCMNGVRAEYRCLCVQNNGPLTYLWIGNGLQYARVDTGEPFTIYGTFRGGNYNEGSMYLDVEREGVEATFSIYQEVEGSETDTGNSVSYLKYKAMPHYFHNIFGYGIVGWKLFNKYLAKQGGTDEIAPIYGVEWDYSQSATTLTRTDDAATFSNPVPATTLAATGASPFDNAMPWSGMKRETIGTDEMVYIPEFYFRVEDDQTNSKIKWQITAKPKDGFTLHPGSGRYIARYHTSNGYASKSGAVPVGGLTRATFRTNSHAKGDKWWMNDVATWSAIQILYLVEYADWDCQSTLGTGQVSGSMVKTGSTDECPYHTLKRNGQSNQYRWIENPFSNIRDYLDGSENYRNRVYVGTDNSKFTDDLSGYVDTGITIPASPAQSYITRLAISEVAPWMFIPSAVNGSPSTYIPDASIPMASAGEYTGRVTGGSYSANTMWGMFKYDSNDQPSFTAADVGARLIYIP